jgi:hypothetical protein
MKKNLLTVLLLFPFWVNAQLYHPLVDSVAVWNEEVTIYGVPTFDNLGFKLFLNGDTLIQSIVFKKLWAQQTYYYSSSGATPNSGENINTTAKMFGAVHEDSTHKVWFREFDFSQVECNIQFKKDSTYLLFDFEVHVSDSLKWMTYAPIVSAIDTIQLLNGEWRKAIHLSNNYIDRVWIAGIGSDAGFFDSYFYNGLECGSVLNCYRKDHELLYERDLDFLTYMNCDSVQENLGLTDFYLSASKLEISPNPVTDFITINFTSSNFSSTQINITDVFGRNLFSSEIKNNQPLQIATEKFAGTHLLFCQLWQEGKLIAVKKVLIQ